MDLKEEAFLEAQEVLKKCATPYGFFAAYPGYDMVFSRDSMITSLGASLLGKKFKKTFMMSLKTLARTQSAKGQIPNAADLFVKKRKHHVDFASIDSSLWFILGHYIFKERYKDSSLFKAQRKNIEKALTWLSYRDMSEDGMPEQLPTTDWQDAFPHRYGHTINTQALYYKVLKLSKKNSEARRLKRSVNNISEVSLWGEDFYLPWRWKNHNKYQEKGEWFDSLGNLLAILFDLASKEQALRILQHIQDENIAKPYPIKSIYPPIRKGSKDWREYFRDCSARLPYHYANAGIWTYIGGFYVLALIKMKNFEDAEYYLQKLAEANMQEPVFNEWLDGRTGKPGKAASGENGNQAWNAGMYILAYESLKEKKVLL